MRVRNIPLYAGIAAVTASTAVAADTAVRGPYLAPMVGYFERDRDDTALEDNDTKGIGLGYQFNGRYAAEFVYGDQSTERDPQSEIGVDIDVRRIDMFRSFNPNGRVVPFLLAGIGQERVDPDTGRNFKRDFGNIGGGWRVNFNENLSVRWDARAILQGRRIDFGEFATNLALVYVFGDAPAAPAAPAPAPAPMPMVGDADGDGVMDDADRCPDTPRNLRVDQRGCPILVKKGVEVDLNVQYEFNKDVVRTEYYPRIEAVADFMKKYSGTTTSLEGHTDSVGGAAYNQGLSERRANAVRDIFINKYGIAPSRLQAVGYGEARPIADNGTAEGRAQNRRTTAVIKATRMEYKKR